MTDRNTERTRQTLEALAMVDYWRNEAEQQRTRAEAAEQDAREERMRADDLLLVVKHCHASSTHAAVMRGLNPAVGAVLDNAGKLAAIRAHLKDVDMKHESMLLTWLEGRAWNGLGISHATTRLLLAAAREALEP